MEPALLQQVRGARKRFIAIAVSYFMGLFNDNFFKEAALIIAVTNNRIGVQSAAAAVFTICYLFGAAPGGWLSDRFAKGHVIMAAKAVEVAAMIAGALGIWTGNWWLILAMIGLMGAQSAVFSPAMNGTIPELYPREYVQTANTVVRILSTGAIFIGMALAGYVMDFSQPAWKEIPLGIFLVGLLVLAAAGIGFMVSLGAPRIAPHRIDTGFPWSGPLESIRELNRIRRDKVLTFFVCGNVYIWSMAAVMTLLMVNLGLRQYQVSAALTAGMKIIFLAGISIGGLISNFIARGHERFFRVFIPCYATMATTLILIGAIGWILPPRGSVAIVIGLITVTGMAGGVILIPLESFIQIRPAANQKGRVIAAANFAVFAAMTVGAVALYLLNRYFLPTTALGILGVSTAGYTFWLSRRLHQMKGSQCST